MDVLALAAFTLIAYTYFGYPILIATLARFSRARVCENSSETPLVSVCIAVHNGAAYAARKLESLLDLDYPADRIEFLIYSDGSVDDTDVIVQRFADRDSRIRLLRDSQRKGKPTALNALCEAARGDVLLMTDIRPPLARETVRALLAPLANPEIGCVSGNLVLTGESGAGAYWRYEKFIRMSEARLGKMVGVSGTIYAVRRSDFPKLPETLILDDVWVPMQIALGKKSITFSEAAAAYDETFDDEREFGRKVRTLAGNYQLFSWSPKLLLPFVNPAWFQMLSHKALRLLCPWALTVLFGASLAAALGSSDSNAVERTFWRLLVIAQCVFYSLAALGQRAGKLAGLARTFVVLNAAALLGLWRFARGTQRVTW